jgi:protein-disulfide isomerase
MSRHAFIRSFAVLLACLASGGAAAARSGAGESAAAVVGSESIPRSVVEAAAAAALMSAQRDHDAEARRLELRLALNRARILEATVGALLDERVLELESAATRVSREQLLAAVAVSAVTDADVLAFYNARARQIQQPLERIAGQIRAHLENQARGQAQAAYLRELRERYGARSRLEPLRLAVDADGPARGPDTAPVTIVEFADFQCPYCAEMEPVVAELRAAYPAEVRWVYRHLPLVTLHPLALGAARAAVCADRQGRFWELHDALFADQSALADEAIAATARRLGLDGEAFDGCLANDAPARKVIADATAADALGLGSTPAFLINGRLVSGTAPAALLRGIIDDELARRRGTPAGGPAAAR